MGLKAAVGFATGSLSLQAAISEEVEIALRVKYHPIRTVIHIEPPDYQREQITFGQRSANSGSLSSEQ